MTSHTLYLAEVRKVRMDEVRKRRFWNFQVIKKRAIDRGVLVTTGNTAKSSGKLIVYTVEAITPEGLVKLNKWPVPVNPKQLTVVSDLGTK